MDDLTDIQAVTQIVLEFIVEYLGGAFDEDLQKKLMERMNAMPSAQPEIIHCKDCKYYVYGDNEEEYYCRNSGIGELETFYCADAERREE